MPVGDVEELFGKRGADSFEFSLFKQADIIEQLALLTLTFGQCKFKLLLKWDLLDQLRKRNSQQRIEL